MGYWKAQNIEVSNHLSQFQGSSVCFRGRSTDIEPAVSKPQLITNATGGHMPVGEKTRAKESLIREVNDLVTYLQALPYGDFEG